MTQARLLDQSETTVTHASRATSFSLSRALPRLTTDARRLSASVMAGIHGRRRAGTGETFWQFRSFVPGEPITRIDWRRSARDDRITIRDREWEAAQTIWIWLDRSPSMAFVSSLSDTSKQERAIVIALAAADMLVRGGERVGMMGLTRPIATRSIIERLAEAMLLKGDDPDEFAPAGRLTPRSEAILVGDFIQPLPELQQRLRSMAGQNARGHLVAIADPVEEIFPFSGHNEFFGTEPGVPMRVGDSVGFGESYRRRIAEHRDGLRAIARELGWSFLLHRTDRPASELLLHLRMTMEGDGGNAFARGG